MRITTKAIDDVTVLAIEGRLDSETAADAQAQIVQLVTDGHRKLVIDLEDVEYISSAGLRVILIAAKSLGTHDGELRVCGLSGMVRDVFDISGFSNVLSVFESQGDALDGF